MEWTGARYRDSPTVEVETFIDAPPAAVWELISDITVMPSTSPELQRIEWCDGEGGATVGATFVGHMEHRAIGSWQVTSHVIECDPPTSFAWAVNDPADPSAVWRFTARPEGSGTRLRESAQLGPGPSGLSAAIERWPDKEQKIVFNRLREFETNMAATLAAFKQLLEGTPASETGRSVPDTAG
jgi:carbon monoxide dehydrogenase subunit G